MEENQVNSVVTEQQTSNEQELANNPAPSNNQVEEQATDRTFTRDEVTKILKSRIDRYQNNVYKKYGVNSSNDLDALIEKAKQYDDIVKSRDELSERVAFLSNNINPDKYDDVKTYFKGKNLQFDENSLKEQLSAHPEWVSKVANKPITTITPLGTEQTERTKMSEKEIAEKLFGMKF